MNEENPIVDSEELDEELGATENEPQEVETEALEGDEQGNAESNESEVSEEDETTENVPVEKQGGLPKGAQKRIDKLTKKLALQAEEHQRELQRLEAQQEQTQQFLDAPAPENLEDLSEGERIQYYTQKGMAESQKQQIDAQKQQAVSQHKVKQWNEKVEARLEDIPDFKEVMASTASTFKLSQDKTAELMEFIGESEVGVDLAYHLGKNPEIANSLQGLSSRAMDRKLMRLEDNLEAQPKQQPKPITKAKAPISSNKGKPSGVSNIANQTGDDFLKSFRARRAQQG